MNTEQPSENFDTNYAADALNNKLAVLYIKFGVPLDSMVYTDVFDSLYSEVVRESAYKDLQRVDVYRRLLGMRKAGILPRVRQDGD